MNNEIGRKITSLTLMTIMIAGGMTFAIPGVMPAAHAAANANLFVSVEDSVFPDRFGGPMVVEVVVNDPDLKDTDETETEPDVTVNGDKLRMVQATDGNWYAYFTDTSMAIAADTASKVAGTGLDFGVFCTGASAGGYAGIPGGLADTFAVAFPVSAGGLVLNAGAPGGINACPVSAGGIVGAKISNVVRENSTATNFPLGSYGQIGLVSNAFPFIQLFDFATDTDATIVYNIGGGSPQSVSIEFDDDLDDFASLSMDRTSYPPGAHVHFEISDNWLNVDPTDEDSWTFGANATNSSTHYQVYDENGDQSARDTDGDGNPNKGTTPNINATSRAALNAGDLGVLLLDVDASGSGTNVIQLFDTLDQNTTGANIDIAGSDGVTGISPLAQDHQIADAKTQGFLGNNTAPVNILETSASSGIFLNTDPANQANVRVAEGALRGTTATIDYNDSAASILVALNFATIDMDAAALGGEWNSGEEIPVLLTDADVNKNSFIDEDITLSDPVFTIIPSLRIGSPTTLAGGSANITNTGGASNFFGGETLPAGDTTGGVTVDAFSDVLRGTVLAAGSNPAPAGFEVINFTFPNAPQKFDPGTTASKFVFLNYDIRSVEPTYTGLPLSIFASNDTIEGSVGTGQQVPLAVGVTDFQGLINLPAATLAAVGGTDPLHIHFNFTTAGAGETLPVGVYPMVVDVFQFGQSGDGNAASERFNDAIYRLELEETGTNSGQFEGSVEYIMLNQINVNRTATYTSGIDPISDAIEIIVHEDLTDEDSPRINYLDLGADGVATQIADQQEAPTHSGVVSFDSSTYKVADTVTITLEDQDLNVDVETIGIFTVVRDPAPGGVLAADADGFAAYDTVGAEGYGRNTAGDAFGRLLDVTFDDSKWTNNPTAGPATCAGSALLGGADDGLGATGFTLVETAADSGIFKGDFQVPAAYCLTDGPTTVASTTGVDMEVNYVDFRDASGEIIEVGDGAGIRANTGSVSLDRTVYPVPWGVVGDIAAGSTGAIDSGGFSVFPIHQTGVSINTDAPGGELAGIVDDNTDTLGNGDLTIHIRVNDPDFDISASGEDKIAVLTDTDSDGTTADEIAGPISITISRGSSELLLATAGGPAAAGDTITVLNTTTTGPISLDAPAAVQQTRELGPITEIAPDAGIFELDFTIRYTDGPASATCPTTGIYTPLDGTVAAAGNSYNRFGNSGITTYCILQGDIITVEYTDPTDASGDPNTVTDSATFDLRNGVLQSDKSVYIIGSDMILTIIEPDWDLDNDGAETYDLDVIEWDSDAATVSMGNAGGEGAAFDPEPSDLRETGDSTGIFQVVIEIPDTLEGDKLERGEEIVLEYTDWGPSGADYVGDEDEDINLTIFTSNFGATVELDQKVYSWTDKVYITIVAPDHNFDSDLIDEIGESAEDPIKVATRGSDLDPYKLVETGTDTGIFTGEVILTGFATHDADGDGIEGDASAVTAGVGPTDGFLPADDDDGITVSFEFSEDETVVGSALIRWNIGEVQWLEASYPATGTGVVRVVDPDLNLNPEAVDNFDVDVWSDSDAGGIDLTVTETNEATGIYEGTVFFTVTDESSGHRLRVSEGDTITAEYEDNTLPDPYTTADELDITGTSIIGTIVPPLERAPASGIRVVDAFGNSLGEVSVDQQVQITSDLANGQDRDQAFAYLVQVQDSNGVTVSLAWITGSLTAGQSFSPALSWIPDASGSYTATAFVWESVDNPTALSPPVTTSVTVV